MNDDIPILKKSYELYCVFHEYRNLVPKHERHTIFERSENTLLDLIELALAAGYGRRSAQVSALEAASVKLNLFRFFIRLMKDTRVLEVKQYIRIQEIVDEIGRMIGGWVRSLGTP